MKRSAWVFFLLLLLVVVPQAVASAQNIVASSMTHNAIHLQSVSFDPLLDGEPVVMASAALSTAEANAPASPYYLVQFRGPVDLVSIRQVEALGGQVLGYVPDNTHIVRIDAANLANIRSLPAVRWVGNYRPSYKLAPELSGQVVAASGASDVYVLAFPGESLSALQASLSAQGATIVQAGESHLGPLVRAQMPALQLVDLLQNPAVSWVEPFVEMRTFNAEARKIMNAEFVWQDFGYYGDGQIVAISDSGLSVQGSMSADFEGRVLKAFAPSEMNLSSPACKQKTTFTDLHGHGTHVAGSVLGNGSLSGSNPANHQYTGSHAGVAPEAKLVFMALNTDGSGGIQCVDENGDFLARGYQTGARISTNSWGGGEGGAYRITSSIVDNYIWQHKDYLVLYAAGNSGPNGTTVGSPGTAKNVLTVGASENKRPDQDADGDNPDQIAGFSSRGPTLDGRVKPDVVAPGTWILSSRAAQAPDGSFWQPLNENYAFMGGTSMATPLTAGGAALVREWMGKQRGIPNPSAALMKAILINGSVQLPGAVIADMNSGYGRVDLKNTLRSNYVIMDDFVQGLTNNQSVSYTLQVVSSTQQGLVIASSGSLPSAEVQAAADSFTLTDQQPAVSAADIQSDASGFTVEALPSSQKANRAPSIRTNAGKSSQESVQSTGVPAAKLTGIPGQSSPDFQPRGVGSASVDGFQFNYVNGGDFEDPEWSDIWQYVWLGEGIPERTSDFPLNGAYSMWLGGSPSQDSIWYPIQFPDKLETVNATGITFNLYIDNEEPGIDTFCVALVDVSGYFIGPYASEGAACGDTENPDGYTYTKLFTAAEVGQLVGQSGYLVLYTLSDGGAPHMSAFVDDVQMYVDFPDVKLSATPSSGPPGTTFLLVGPYNIPYGEVWICTSPCPTSTAGDNFIKSVYADAAGNLAAFLYSAKSIAPGQYPIQTSDYADRLGDTVLTIGDGSAGASLSVNPASGPAGTAFNFTGAGFVPNDKAIQVTVNGQALGSVGSNANGQISFELKTKSNTSAGEYTLTATDSQGNTATAKMTVTAGGDAEPSLTVSPASGPPGTAFVFQARNFTPSTPAEVKLDGQKVGDVTIDEAGQIQITINTTTTTPPGQYTLAVIQGDKQASAQYAVSSGSGGGGSTGDGSLNLTLVWTDPPAQTSASKTLINDLNLIVQGPGGTVYASGANAPDNVNNVEVVRLKNPTLGTYIITVAAARINGQFGAQPFALVASSDLVNANAANVAIGGGSGAQANQQVYLPVVSR